MLHSLFYPLAEPHDELLIQPGRSGEGLVLSCSDSELEGPGNILYAAYAAFCRAAGVQPDLQVRLEKFIPMGAGLGGGSSDAAALLVFLNENAGSPLGADQLQTIALSLGADVPFFLQGKPALAGGIGEVLHPLEVDLTGTELILICPGVHVSTADAYHAWDKLPPGKGRSLTRTYGMDKKPLCISEVVLFNDFEPAVFPLFPELRNLKLAMLRFGAAACVMSGSGAALVALFREPQHSAPARHWLESRKISHFVHQF